MTHAVENNTLTVQGSSIEGAATDQDTSPVPEATSTITQLAESESAMQNATPTNTGVTVPTTQTAEYYYFEDEFGVPLALIPGGSFLMGSEWGDDDEAPVHEVTVDAFYIDVYEVTNELYVRFLEEVGNQEEGGTTWLEAGSEYGNIFQSSSGWLIENNYEDHPVVMVSWYGARAFCEWRGGRLPTEAEWEKAARGGLEGALYPWGDELPITTFGAENGAQFGDYGVTTVPVGKYTPNGYGLYDMCGNVCEWVADYYDANYYSNSPTENPHGPEHSSSFVVRDGSWAFEAFKLRVSYRHWGLPTHKFSNYGFRCARIP
jgi:formylglycine-generating enzyme required for sulfatase activity